MTSLSSVPARQRIWKALRVQKTCDVHILAAAAAAPDSSTREYLGLLVRAGYVGIVQQGNGRTGRVKRYRLMHDTGPRAPKRMFDFMQDGNTQAMIPLASRQNSAPGVDIAGAMQIPTPPSSFPSVFTKIAGQAIKASAIPARQLVWDALRIAGCSDARTLASTAETPITSAREYLALLVRSGYAVVLEHGNGRNGKLTRYQLVNDTGPHAPGRVFDFMQDGNTGEMMPLATAQSNGRGGYRQEVANERRARFNYNEAADAAEARLQAAERNAA